LIADPPGWVLLPLIAAGITLIWWDARRNQPAVEASAGSAPAPSIRQTPKEPKAPSTLPPDMSGDRIDPPVASQSDADGEWHDIEALKASHRRLREEIENRNRERSAA